MRFGRFLLLASTLIAVATGLLSSRLLTTHNASANPLGGLASIAAGEGQSCAITDAGGAKCWGESDLLGGVVGTSVNLAVDVPGLSSGVAQISAGLTETCAVTSSGGLMCWGRGEAPADVPGLTSGVAQVDVGNGHACVVTTAGGAKCWEDSGYFGNQPSPVDVEGLQSGVVAIDVGIEHTCAVMDTGGVKCWGRNQYGELGDGTTSDRLAPVTVNGLAGATAVATGLNQSCAVTSSGGVKCWGFHYGPTPVDVPGLTSGVAAIGSLYNHMCALADAGSVACWGANDYGQLGDGYACGIACRQPANVAGLSSGVTHIAVGVNHTCAIVGGSATCWGNNFMGQLGDGNAGGTAVSPLPVPVVEQDAKQPSCPPEGCPTPPRRPVPHNGLDFSIGVDVDGDGMEDCGTQEDQAQECAMPVGQAFTLIIDLHSLAADMTGYAGTDLIFDPGAFHFSTFDFTWADCANPVSFAEPRLVALGCDAGAQFESTYVGPMVEVPFVCSGTGSITLLHGSGFTDLFERGLLRTERSGGGETLSITCGEKIAGDVDCNTSIDSVDAVLTLQREATLVDRVNCAQQADVNMDNRANAIDAALTLQYTAGYIATLPVAPAE